MLLLLRGPRNARSKTQTGSLAMRALATMGILLTMKPLVVVVVIVLVVVVVVVVGVLVLVALVKI